MSICERRRRGFWPLGGILVLTGCGGSGADSSPTEPPWETPTIVGDGLPPPESTVHGTPPPVGVTPTPGETEGSMPPEGPSLEVVSGLFAWSSKSGFSYTGSLILTVTSVGCHDLFGASDTVSPDGLYFSLVPIPFTPYPDAWLETYQVCGSPPCLTGYSKVAGVTESLEPDSWLQIVAYDEHYLTVDWYSSVSEGAGLRFYNCGDRESWYY